jgi:hypothetical protein
MFFFVFFFLFFFQLSLCFQQAESVNPARMLFFQSSRSSVFLSNATPDDQLITYQGHSRHSNDGTPTVGTRPAVQIPELSE